MRNSILSKLLARQVLDGADPGEVRRQARTMRGFLAGPWPDSGLLQLGRPPSVVRGDDPVRRAVNRLPVGPEEGEAHAD